MYLSFADNCVVHVEDINENLVSFIRSSNWKYHIIDNKTEVDISIKRINFGILLPDMILHPNFEASGEYFVFKDVGGFRVGFDFSVIGRGKAEILVEENYQVSTFMEILFELIKVVLMGKGVACIHASSYEHNSSGTIIVGWEGIGKSAVMLKKVYSGHRFLSDDRSFISKTGKIYPIYSDVKQYSGEFPFFRELLEKVNLKSRVIIKINIVIHWAIRETKHPKIKWFLDKLLKVLKKIGLYEIEIPLNSIDLAQNIGYSVNKVYLLQQIPDVAIKEDIMDNSIKKENLNKILFTTKFDDNKLIKLYLTYKYLFPFKTNPVLEQYDSCVLEILHRAMENVEFQYLKIPKGYSIVEIIKELDV